MSSTRVSKSKNKTICETSKIVAYSLIKASSFTLSKLALCPPPPLRTRTQPSSNSVSVETVQALEPVALKEIDERAAEFILRVRANNMSTNC